MWEEGLSAAHPQLIAALVVHQVASKICSTLLRYSRDASFDHIPRIWNTDIAPSNDLCFFSCQGELNRGTCHSVNQWTCFWFRRLKNTAECRADIDKYDLSDNRSEGLGDLAWSLTNNKTKTKTCTHINTKTETLKIIDNKTKWTMRIPHLSSW